MSLRRKFIIENLYDIERIAEIYDMSKKYKSKSGAYNRLMLLHCDQFLMKYEFYIIDQDSRRSCIEYDLEPFSLVEILLIFVPGVFILWCYFVV